MSSPAYIVRKDGSCEAVEVPSGDFFRLGDRYYIGGEPSLDAANDKRHEPATDRLAPPL